MQPGLSAAQVELNVVQLGEWGERHLVGLADRDSHGDEPSRFGQEVGR